MLAARRNPESHVAGGAAINRSDASPRYSSDLNIFHEAAESMTSSAQADARTLEQTGHVVTWLLQQDGFYRAEVRRENDSLRLDWTVDTAFRFFPVQPDQDFGYALHPADLAVNKVLALAGRNEIRDYLDILFVDKS